MEKSWWIGSELEVSKMYAGESYFLNWVGLNEVFFSKLIKENRKENSIDCVGTILRDTIPDDDDNYTTMGINSERNEIYARLFSEHFPDGWCTPHEAFDFFKSIADEYLADEPQCFIDDFKNTLNSVTYEEWRDLAMKKVPWMFEDEPLD